MNNFVTSTMIPNQEVFQLRLTPLVKREIAEDQDHLYLEKYPEEEWLTYLLAKMMKYLSLEQFMILSDDKLRGLIGRQMAVHLVTGMLNDFTAEQMQLFDECLIRR